MNNIKKTKKVLSLSNDTPITYDLRLAVPLMAALSYPKLEKSVWQWIFTNYTQIVCKKTKNNTMKYNHFHIFDPYNPFIKRTFELFFRFNFTAKEMLKHIINKIDKGIYVYIKLDRYYMPGYYGHNEEHYCHTECIYGYDVSNEELYLIGFPDLADSNLKRKTIKFYDFINAFNSFRERNRIYTITYDSVNVNASYSTDYSSLYKQTKNYSESQMSFIDICALNQKKKTIFSWDFPSRSVYGIQAANEINNVITIFAKTNRKKQIRTILHAICEFENIMLLRIKFLSQSCSFSNQLQLFVGNYESICKEYEIVKKMFLKYELTQNEDYLSKIQSRIKQAQEFEKKTINEFLTLLSPEDNQRKKTCKTFITFAYKVIGIVLHEIKFCSQLIINAFVKQK